MILKRDVTGISLALLKVLIVITRTKNFIAAFFMFVTLKPIVQLQLITDPLYTTDSIDLYVYDFL
jgi:hypothetical protein